MSVAYSQHVTIAFNECSRELGENVNRVFSLVVGRKWSSSLPAEDETAFRRHAKYRFRNVTVFSSQTEKDEEDEMSDKHFNGLSQVTPELSYFTPAVLPRPVRVKKAE